MHEPRDICGVSEAILLRRFQHLAAFALVAGIIAAPACANEFLKAIDDVPLVAGLTELADPLVFESDQGRVVRTSAEGQVGATTITTFYTETLPALGWKRTDDLNRLSFVRENEELNLQIREPASNRPVTVSFELIVKLASTRLPE